MCVCMCVCVHARHVCGVYVYVSGMCVVCRCGHVCVCGVHVCVACVTSFERGSRMSTMKRLEIFGGYCWKHDLNLPRGGEDHAGEILFDKR